MNNATKKTFHRVVAAALASAILCAVLPFSVFAADGVSDLLTVDGNALYANGQALTITDAPNGQDSLLYVGDTLVRDLTIAGDANGTDGYDLSDATIFAGSQNALDPSATTASITVAGGNVGAIYAGGEALLTTDISAEVTAMHTALAAALAALTLTESELSDKTIASLNAVIANLEAMLAEFEADYVTGTQSVTDILAALAALESAITSEIAPYLAETSERYIGEVGALLLADVEDALIDYIDALEARLTAKLEAALYATLLDALCIVLGADALTVEDLAAYQAAIENLSTVIKAYEAYEAAQANTTAAKAAWLALTSTYTSSDLESFVAKNSQTVSIPYVGSRTYQLTLSSFVTDDSDDGYAILTAWKNGAVFTNYSAYYTFTSSNSLAGAATAGAEVTLLGLLYDDFRSNVDDSDSDASLTELSTAYYAAAAAEAAALITLTGAVTNAYDDITLLAGLLGVEALEWDNITDIGSYIASLSNSLSEASATISFIAELATLLTELSAGGDTVEILSEVYTLISESGMTDDLQAILLAALENLYDEFNEAYLAEELTHFTAAMLGALEIFHAQLGTEGYPNDLEGQLCEMLATVLANLEATGADATIIAAFEALYNQLTASEDALRALTGTMYADIMAYLTTTEEISTSAIKEIILDALLPALEASLLEVLGTELAVMDSVSVTVTSGSVGALYASGADAGYIASGVVVSVSGGSIGEIVNTMPTTAEEAAAYLSETLPTAVCDAISDAVDAALADFVAPAITLTGGDYTSAPDAAYIPAGYTLTDNEDGTFTIENTTLEDANDLLDETLNNLEETLADLGTSLEDLLADLSDTDTDTTLTTDQAETIITATASLADLDKETLASDSETVEKLNTLDALFLAAVKADEGSGSLIAEATIEAPEAIATEDQLGSVSVEGLAAAVYGSGSTPLPDNGTNVTLSLEVAQQEVTVDPEDDDAPEALTNADMATVFAFSAKPYSTTTVDGNASNGDKTLISNDVISTPITFSIYLPESFPAEAKTVTVLHYFSEGSARYGTYETLSCTVLTDADGARYIKVTVTEFSDFVAIPNLLSTDDNTGNDNSGNGGNNGNTGNSGNSSSNNSTGNTSNTIVTDDVVIDSADSTTDTTSNNSSVTTTGSTGSTGTTDADPEGEQQTAPIPAIGAIVPEGNNSDLTTDDAVQTIVPDQADVASTGVTTLLLCLFAAVVFAGTLIFILVKRYHLQAED